MEKENNKNKWLIPLIVVIAILVIGLIGGVGYLLLNKSKTTNIYYEFIDTLRDNLVAVVDDAKVLENETGVTGNIKVNMASENKDVKKIAEIVNKLELTVDTNINYQDKQSSMTYGLNYNNTNLANLDLYLNNNKAYANLNDLYDKVIDLNSENINLSEIWEIKKNKEYKIIIEETADVLKKSLNKEFFTVSDENNLEKHTLTLKGNNLYIIGKNFISNLKSNKKLMNALIEVTGKSEQDIVEIIGEYVNDLENTQDKLVINIYLKKNTVEKINVNYNEEIIDINRTKDNTYEIVVQNNVIGNIEVSKNKIKLNIDYENNVINLELNTNKNDSNFKLNGTIDNDELDVTLSKNDNKINGEVKVKSNEYKTDITLTFNLTQKEKVTIKNMNVGNSININDMKESDYNKIIINASKNKNILKLIQDVSALFN